MTQAAIQATYEIADKLLHKLVYDFHRQYKGDIEELRNEALLHFMRAYHSYDRSLASFNTWMGNQVWRGLLSSKIKATKRAMQLPRSFPSLDSLKAPVKFDLDAWLLQLSDDAKYAAGLAINPPKSLAKRIKQKGGGAQRIRKAIRDHLSHKRWDEKRIETTFSEIRKSLP